MPGEKAKQVAFLGVLLAATLFMLSEAWKLDFFVRDSIGPGFYPALVLAALGLSTLAALIGALVRREIVLLSPFTEGLRHDTILRGLAREAAGPLGRGVRVVARNGAGVFSAAWSGARAGDGATLTVASSETPDLTPAEAAHWSGTHFEPVARLFFDPDVAVGRAGTSFDRLTAHGTRPRIGFAGDASASVAGWLSDRLASPIDGSFGADAEALIAEVGAGALDAAVLPLGEVREALADDSLVALAVFAEAEDEAAGFGPLAADIGPPLVSGAWAGIAAPGAAVIGRAHDLHRAFAEALAAYRRDGRAEEDDQAWSVETPDRFRSFLAAMAQSAGSAQVAMPVGRLAGLLVAITGTVGFFWLMELLGFPLAAFCFLVVLMFLLEPQLNRLAAARIVTVSAAVSIGLHQLFWRVFYVVFPDGLLFGP
ncbi:MAG: hypothetical protein ACK4QW_02185 [Alphaproteobacteria bacterium]